MEWLDTAIVLGAIFSSFLWMNGKFYEIDKRFAQEQMKFAEIQKDMAMIKTVLLMKNILPVELTTSSNNKE